MRFTLSPHARLLLLLNTLCSNTRFLPRSSAWFFITHCLCGSCVRFRTTHTPRGSFRTSLYAATGSPRYLTSPHCSCLHCLCTRFAALGSFLLLFAAYAIRSLCCTLCTQHLRHASSLPSLPPLPPFQPLHYTSPHFEAGRLGGCIFCTVWGDCPSPFLPSSSFLPPPTALPQPLASGWVGSVLVVRVRFQLVVSSFGSFSPFSSGFVSWFYFISYRFNCLFIW